MLGKGVQGSVAGIFSEGKTTNRDKQVIKSQNDTRKTSRISLHGVRVVFTGKRNPNPMPIGLGFGFLLLGAGNRGRTCTNEHKILNLARLPIPPYPRRMSGVWRNFNAHTREE